MHHRYPYEQSQDEDYENLGVAIPASMAMGGMIAVVIMAGWRWLNGGDFVLFPQPVTSVEELEEEEEIIPIQEEPELKSIDILSEKIENLTKSVQELIQNQKSASQNREFTDSAMNLLRKQSTNDENISTLIDKLNRYKENPANDLKKDIEMFLDKQLKHPKQEETKATAALLETPPIPSSEENLQNHRDKIDQAIQTLYERNETQSPSFQSAIKMLHLYTTNLLKNKDIPRYRKIYTNNTSFQDSVGTVQGGSEFLLQLGFEWNDKWLEFKGGDDGLLQCAQTALSDCLKQQQQFQTPMKQDLMSPPLQKRSTDLNQVFMDVDNASLVKTVDGKEGMSLFREDDNKKKEKRGTADKKNSE